MDPRDTLTWVAIEITHQGEMKVEDGTLEGVLRSDLGVGPEHPIFIPAQLYTRNGKQVVVWLMAGYVFVASGLPETTYFKLENKSYVERVVSTSGIGEHLRVPQTLRNDAIIGLRQQLQRALTSHLKVGERVKVLEGAYQGLEGVVVGITDDQVQVKIELRSLKATLTVPRACIGEVKSS